MTVRTYDKDGKINTCWKDVKKIKLLTLPSQRLMNLNLTLETGEEIDYYLSDHERFAVIE